jgi:hypothetical protein
MTAGMALRSTQLLTEIRLRALSEKANSLRYGTNRIGRNWKRPILATVPKEVQGGTVLERHGEWSKVGDRSRENGDTRICNLEICDVL